MLIRVPDPADPADQGISAAEKQANITVAVAQYHDFAVFAARD